MITAEGQNLSRKFDDKDLSSCKDPLVVLIKSAAKTNWKQDYLSDIEEFVQNKGGQYGNDFMLLIMNKCGENYYFDRDLNIKNDLLDMYYLSQKDNRNLPYIKEAFDMVNINDRDFKYIKEKTDLDPIESKRYLRRKLGIKSMSDVDSIEQSLNTRFFNVISHDFVTEGENFLFCEPIKDQQDSIKDQYVVMSQSEFVNFRDSTQKLDEDGNISMNSVLGKRISLKDMVSISAIEHVFRLKDVRQHLKEIKKDIELEERVVKEEATPHPSRNRQKIQNRPMPRPTPSSSSSVKGGSLENSLG